MRCDAVIFDLFGTLVDNLLEEKYGATVRETGAAAGADPEAFFRLWTDPEVCSRRDRGLFGTQAACIEYVCRRLGLSPDEAAVRRAARVREEYLRRALSPRADAVPTLRTLRQKGLKLGLMSACSTDTPRLWPETPLSPLFDAALFSCSEGMNKPAPGFYALACERLSVGARRCLYVGDGAGNELMGAAAAGMHPVLICAPHEEHIVMQREAARNWRGPRIAALSEVLRLLDEP